jgi:hypothetical protein
MRIGEFGSQAPNRHQLLVEIRQQRVTIVSKLIGSGAGSACNSASMRSCSVASISSLRGTRLTATLTSLGSNNLMQRSISRRSTSREASSFIAPAV